MFGRYLRGVALTLVAAASAYGQVELSPETSSLLEKANAGDAAAQFLLANAYDAGRGAPRDATEAMRWYHAAAAQGYPEAQNSVGSGLQAEQRYAEALPWYEMAAAQHHALATNNLGYLYDLGLGVAQDRRRAAELYLRAADLGWPEAMWNLANLYGAGQLGSQPDLLSACIWTLRAKRFADAAEAELNARVSRVVPMLEQKLSSVQWASCGEKSESWSPPALAMRSDRPG